MSSIVREIWVVDDESIITRPLQRLISSMLRREQLTEQYEIITHNYPERALALLPAQSRDIALVVADIMMPQLNGLDFLVRMKQFQPMAPRIILTGYADKENAIRALNELELFAYVEKPWNNDLFRQLVLSGLEKISPKSPGSHVSPLCAGGSH